jgi:glycosyltransferase involved in cell wall biosynthesis
MRPVKVAYILPNVESGGTERHVLALARRLDRSRFDLSLITTAGGGALYGDFAALLPVTVFGDPGKGRRFRTGPLEHLRTIARAARLLRRDRPDIVHAYLPAANVIGPAAARLAGVPRVIVSKRALADYKRFYPFLRRVEPLGNRLADVILVNSDAVRRDVERAETQWEGKFRKIYNGVEPLGPWTSGEIEAFRIREGLPPRSPLVVCVSNFYPYKGHAELVEAAARVVRRFPDATFLLVGRDSGTLEETKSRVRERGLDGAMRFLGSRTDVPDFLRASDLFVHPSREEGFSNAVLEAMSAGLPVVAFDVGGNAEAVEHGVTGLLAPERDPAALGAAMGELLADADRRRAMGEAGRKRAAESFSLDRMVAEMEEMYGSLAGEGR